ncbi:MAG: hypothetical protein IPJ88_06900 [Myxococcales bacterium]|nr:MAG: hypothetical protein IPJ88_06900 [Myxococcales bacterium]
MPRKGPDSEIPTATVSAEEASQFIKKANQLLPEDEDLTVISEVSQNFESFESSSSSLSNPSKSKPGSKHSKPSPTTAADFPALYKEFIELKKKCGETTAGFTYDKFLNAITKNKEQIQKRHKAKHVRFTVYEKDGKASLKAKPVKK